MTKSKANLKKPLTEVIFIGRYKVYKVATKEDEAGILCYDYRFGEWDIRNSGGVIISGNIDNILTHIEKWEEVQP